MFLYNENVYKNINLNNYYSMLTYYKRINFFIKDENNSNNILIKKIDNKKVKVLYEKYSLELYKYLKFSNFFQLGLSFLLQLIEFKCNKDKKNMPKTILDYLTNIYYPETTKNLSLDLKYDYFNNEYSWSTPDSNIIQQIVDFVGDMKILEIAAGIGFWSYLFKAYGLNIIPTGIKNYIFHNNDEYQIEDWIEVENLTYEEAFKKYNDAEVLFLWWGTTDFNIDNFKGKYVILVGEYDMQTTFYIDEDDKKYKLLTKTKISHTLGIYDYLFIYEKL